MKVIIAVSLLVCFAEAFVQRSASPEFLDGLLAAKKYDEFSRYMDINLPYLSKINEENSNDDTRTNPDLHEGDILLSSKQLEQARQGIRFDRYPRSRWPNDQGEPSFVPYTISSLYSENDQQTINSAIQEWNEKIACLKFREREDGEEDYVFVFQGDGCYANLGRTGGQQSLSLGRGCVDRGIILHVMEHVVGIGHEHNRFDRDEYIEVLWENIPRNWRNSFVKNDPNVYADLSNYDYYSLMHASPRGGQPFRFLKPVEEHKVGNRPTFSDTDIEKLNLLYCPEEK